MEKTDLSNAYNHHFKFLLPFAMLFVSVSTAIMAVVYKQVQLGHVIVNAGAIAMPLYFGLSDLIAEIYGYKTIRQIIRSARYSMIEEAESFTRDIFGWSSLIEGVTLTREELVASFLKSPVRNPFAFVR